MVLGFSHINRDNQLLKHQGHKMTHHMEGICGPFCGSSSPIFINKDLFLILKYIFIWVITLDIYFAYDLDI